MTFASNRVFRPLGAAAFALSISCTALPGMAEPMAGPFAALAGSWSGAGTISINNGQAERIRCRVTYELSPSGANLQQNLRCASDSYRFDVDSSLIDTGGAVAGQWAETTRNVVGNFNGRAEGDAITGTVVGTGFSASLAVSTHGNQQVVTIRPQGGTDVREISVSLRRG